jgi:hypothetical protein
MAVEFKLEWNKALAAITFLAAHDVPALSKGKLCKLVFLADKYHLVRFGRTVTGDCYYAIPNGPVPSAILTRLDALEEHRDDQLGPLLQLDTTYAYPRISAKQPVGMENLSDSDILALQRTLELFGGLTFDELRDLTHGMPAYDKAWENRGNCKRSLMAFEDFFEDDDEAVGGVFDEMVETDVLNKVFAAR